MYIIFSIDSFVDQANIGISNQTKSSITENLNV